MRSVPAIPPMSISLDQLKVQRDLVKRHLEWLDARIAEHPGADILERNAAPEPAVAPAPAARRSPLIPVSADARSEATHEKSSPLIAPGVAATAALPVDTILEAHGSMESGISKNAKFGCIAIAAAVALGFIFVLFVLPHFLYGGKRSTTPETAPTERTK